MKYKYINKFVFYYSKQSFRLQDDGLEPIERSNLAKVMIVARQHYIERAISLPITLTKDVNAAIQFEIESLQSEFHLFHKIISTADGKTQVMIWQIPRDIVPKGVMLVLPETYLLSFILETNQVCVYQAPSGAGPVKLVKTTKKICSSASEQQSLAIFSQAAGVNLQNTLDISAEEFLSHLLNALKISVKHLVTGFWVKPSAEKKDWGQILKPLIVPIATFFIGYLAITSLYVSYRLSTVSNMIEDQREDIDTVLTLQSSIHELQNQIEQYQSMSSSEEPAFRMWQVFAPLYKQGIQFKFIRYNGQQVFFSASAKSASKVLEQLLNVKTVISPQFSTAVRKTGDEETFIIKFSLAAEESLDE
ncbi:hypothetical protein [Shewanella sediminis]|nr:hypothetical protein [Shewanella sediminis]